MTLELNELSFREATHDDLPTLVAMLADDSLGAAREIVSDPVDRRYEEALAAVQRDPNNQILVVEDQQQILGTFQLTFLPNLSRLGAWRCQIEGVRIQASFRGQGLGKWMIQEGIRRAKERNCLLVQLTSDKRRQDALKFYQDLGFEPTHEGFKLFL